MSLVYVDDSLPGITRRQLRGKWAYFAPDGTRIADRAEIDRLNAIALPPAYGEAWFAPSAQAHILATGIDARGRKQYRYHPDFRTSREVEKFDSCARFGRKLPLVRARVESDLAQRGLKAERAIASVVRLLDTGAIRIGNEAYARANASFGATTLCMRHARLQGQTLHLHFTAKSGKDRAMRVTDRGLARFVRTMQDLPGQHLFQYLDDAGVPHPVSSGEVNAYIREAMGEDFTAKHFRTWTASALAFGLIAGSKAPVPAKVVLAEVAERLGNTPAIARKSYLHPAVLALAGEGFADAPHRLPRATRWLARHERGLIDFLEASETCAGLLVTRDAK